MAITKIIPSTLLVSFLVSTFALVQGASINTGISDNTKYGGKWYTIGFVAEGADGVSSCIQFNVIPNAGESISININAIDVEKNVHKFTTPASIDNGQLSINWMNHYTSSYTILEYNSGTELILCRIPNFEICVILSRTTSASNTLLTGFSKLNGGHKKLLMWIKQIAHRMPSIEFI